MKSYRHASSLSWKKVGNEILIIDSRINQEVHRLNGVASFIWEKCVDATKNDILNNILETYDISEADALSDLNGFLDELTQKKILEQF